MSLSEHIIKHKPVAPRILIYGDSGIGKTTLASCFPNPVFVQCEDVNPPKAIAKLPVCASIDDVIKWIDMLLTEEHDYKTIVIDSISKLDKFVVDYILSQDPKKATTLAMACGGYGAGYQRAALVHEMIKRKLDAFREKGISVVYIAHQDIKKYKSPEFEDFDIYTIQANHDLTRAVYINDCDAVLFCRVKTAVTQNESGRNVGKSLRERIMVTGVSPLNVSKNRYNLPEEMALSFDELAKHIHFYKQETK